MRSRSFLPQDTSQGQPDICQLCHGQESFRIPFFDVKETRL
jgi:hypothetical protein